MKSVTKRPEEARKVYDLFWDSYQKGDLDTFASTLADDFEMIGTSESEIAHSKADGIVFFKAQMEEVVGKAEMRNRLINVLQRDPYILINETCDIYVITGSEWNFYSKIRISTWLKETEDGWKVIQQHGSLPDMRVAEGETLAIEKINKENLELRDAIKRRTLELENKSKELEIEASLERVRTVAMGMKTPDDMLQICRVIADQLESIGVHQIRNVQTAIIESKEEIYLCYQYFPSYNRDIIERTEYPKNPVEQQMVNQMLAARDSHFLGALTGEELVEFRLHRKREKHLADPLLDETEDLGYCFLSIGEGGLGITLYRSLDEQSLALFKRFHQVFSLTYQRFRDIQKAEAQAREAQIEAALERVRAKSMAMHTTEGLADVIETVFKQFELLDVRADSCFINIHQSDSDDWNLWVSTGGRQTYHLPVLPYLENPVFRSQLEARKKGSTFYTGLVDKKAKDQFFEHFFHNLTDLEVSKDRLDYIYDAKGIATSFTLSKHATIALANYSCIPYTEEENSVLQRIGSVFEQTYTRFLDLQKAEAQTRESEIELALERIRAKTMAMRQSSELSEAATVLFEQVFSLGFEPIACAFAILNKENKTGEVFISADGSIIPQSFQHPYSGEPAQEKIFRAWKNEESYSIIDLDGKPLQTHLQFIAECMPVQDMLKSSGQPQPERLVLHIFNFKHGFLGVNFLELELEVVPIMERFAKVFEQTYTRFLDLQKAEAQAREAQIEAALERVRSKTMAMYKSTELNSVLSAMFRELTDLDFELARCVIWIFNESDKSFSWYSANPEAEIETYHVPFSNYKVITDYWEAWEKRVPKMYYELSGKLKEGMDEFLFNHTEMASMPQEVKEGMKAPQQLHIYNTFNDFGVLLIPATQPQNEEIFSILERFGNVFNQSYTRFLDIQKAEAQAREAQIEAALERVRAQTMAMHNSEDVGKCIVKMFSELTALGVDEGTRFGIGILNHENENNQLWTARKNGDEVNMHIGNIDMASHPLLKSARKAWKEQVPFHKYVLEGQDLLDYYKMLNNAPDYKIQIPLEKLPKKEIQHCFIFDHGFFYAFSPREFQPELIHITQRFSSLFAQTYRRYLDLVKAEEQVREAQIEAALERVRSRTLAMQKSEELAETAAVLFNQLVLLGIEPNRLYIGIIKDDKGYIEFWATNEDGSKVNTQFTGDASRNSNMNKMFEAWKTKKKSMTIRMEGKELSDYFEYLGREMNVPFTDGLSQKKRIQTIAFFGKGMLGIASPDEQPAETTVLLERFAAVFNLTYTRFNDLKIAESNAIRAKEDLIKLKKAKARAEKALKDLEAAQEQLVQQEKLASLGQLTAGIAHEIKNPLNFVNNFSDLSRELIDEVFEELENLEDSDAKEEIVAILNDVKANLSKVHEHGARADSIVSSMLQHSRASGSKREPKPFNPLVKEFVNLSFHGMRAGKAPINVDIDLQLDPKIGEVTLISEDFSRVILNLCNNAFDAMRDKFLKSGDGRRETEDRNSYMAKLTVKTSLQKDKVLLSIADNGGGIPEEIKDKILQPFFTTKKGTDGTGLGLSITHDIVKAHGGSLQVSSTVGAGTEMNIFLPID